MEALLNKTELNNYLKEINKCKNEGGELASKCVEDVSLQYLRNIPGMKDMVYHRVIRIFIY